VQDPLRILAVDTALGACSAALIEDGHTIAYALEPMERGHAERLAPMVKDVLGAAQAAPKDIDRLAVTVGPGTFTGQRVGIAFMRGLRIALKKPLVGVTTLEAMLAEASNTMHIGAAAVLHDARRGEVYCAASRAGELVLPVALLPQADALQAIRDALGAETVAVAGTAAAAALQAWDKTGMRAVDSAVRHPDARWVARLAFMAQDPVAVPRPLYLRPPDARLPAAR